VTSGPAVTAGGGSPSVNHISAGAALSRCHTGDYEEMLLANLFSDEPPASSTSSSSTSRSTSGSTPVLQRQGDEADRRWLHVGRWTAACKRLAAAAATAAAAAVAKGVQAPVARCLRPGVHEFGDE
jgi:hypothetical protein